MKTTVFLVALADPTEADPSATTEHQVTVINPDRLRAEQTAVRLGLPNAADAQLTAASLWCWAALKRTGTIPADLDAKTFLNDVLMDLEKHRETPVDPTRSGPGTDKP